MAKPLTNRDRLKVTTSWTARRHRVASSGGLQTRFLTDRNSSLIGEMGCNSASLEVAVLMVFGTVFEL